MPQWAWADAVVLWVAEDPTRAVLWLGAVMTPLMVAGLWAAQAVLKEDERARRKSAKARRAAEAGRRRGTLYKTD